VGSLSGAPKTEEQLKADLENRPDRDELSRFVATAPGATFFHTFSWLDSLERAFPRFKIEWLTAREGEALAGVMPFVKASRGPFYRLLSLPFGTYGDPLARDGDSWRALLERFFHLAAAPLCVEAAANIFAPEGLREAPRGVRLRTEECRLISLEGGIERAWRRASKERRRLSRRAEEAGVVVRPLDGAAELRRFYEIYLEESRVWGGIHPYPFELFSSLYERRAEGAIVWGAYLDGELLGGHVDFYFGSMAQAWQAAMADRANRHEAGAILVKKAIEEACARGMRVFNLGSSGGNEGLLFFKESLGGVEHRYSAFERSKLWWRLARRG
jgi:CelD/BcsL family acetyltransferase involved in cellulose biosynthesis